MRKVISWILFIVTLVVFAFGIYFTVFGSIDVKNTLDSIAARGGSGVDYLGSGADIFVMLVILIFAVLFIFSIVSSIVAKSFAIRIISLSLIPLFVLQALACAGLVLSR